MEIGFYIHVNTKPKATVACLESVRKFYPNALIAMSCDNGYDFTDIAKQYNCFYHHNNLTLGYPEQPYGYKGANALEWLDRMYRSVILLSSTDYYCMIEDDVLLIDKITIDPSWEMAGQQLRPNQVPEMPEEYLNIIEKFSGKRPKQNVYNCGGGSIFKTSTFLNNYERVREFLGNNIDRIQNEIYPTIGWMDCLMCSYFYFCGADLVENKKLYNNWPCVNPFDFKVPEGTEIVHYVKDNY